MRAYLLVIATVCACATFDAVAQAQEKPVVKGNVVKLTGKKSEFGALPGSLIVVPVEYSGFVPPKDIVVDGGTMTKIGQVSGNQDAEGNPKPEAGYVWYLFVAPEKSGSYKVKLSDTPTEAGAKKTEREFTVNVSK